MNELNLAALLKNCPKDTKLYSPIFGNVWFQRVRDTGYATMIDVTTSCNTEVNFYSNGKWNKYYSDSEVMLFPSKTQRDWNKFQRPIVEGDVVVCEPHQIFLVREWIEDNSIECHIGYDFDTNDRYKGFVMYDRIATEYESKRLFKMIEKDGYHWNPETKTLENAIRPKFKVGDKIRHKTLNKDIVYEISKVCDDSYEIVDFTFKLDMKYQDLYELSPTKFDINTLNRFDMVFVRDRDTHNWIVGFYSHYDPNGKKFYITGDSYYFQCVPYIGNEHLFDTSNDCDEYFKNW